MKLNFKKLEEKFNGKQLTTPFPITYVQKLALLDTIFINLWIYQEAISLDPNTKVAAAIYNVNTGNIFIGVNEFPSTEKNTKEFWDNRDKDNINCKYNRVVHAEGNAIKKALKAGNNMKESILLTTHYPCNNCVKNFILDSEIKEIFYLSEKLYDPLSQELLYNTYNGNVSGNPHKKILITKHISEYFYD